MSKVMMVKAITEHLAKDGKRMTNLNKASIEKLDELIDKYEIDIVSYAIKYKDELKMKRIKDKKDKKERQDKEDDMHNECMKRNALIKQLCLTLNDELIIKKRVYVMEIENNHYWKENGVKLLERNDKIIKAVDTEYEKLKKQLPSNTMLERVNETTINVRGINVNYGGLSEKGTSKEWISNVKQNLGRTKQNLFDFGMLQVLCEDSKYYLNCKSEYILTKQKKKEDDYLKMINEIEKYVKDKYPLLNQKYKMSFVGKSAGVVF
jgi:cellobiose-specific phosphotransferase system component IIB